MMVPLRRALIVKEHDVLPYPEGTACAEVLVGYVMPRISQFPNATMAVDISPEYLGVGYVIGPRIARPHGDAQRTMTM